MTVIDLNHGDTEVTQRELPKGWSWVRLGDVAQYINGRAFKPEDWGKTGLPIIRIQNLTSLDAAFNYYDGDVEDQYIIHDGDLLISWSASLDAFIWDRGTAILNQHIFKVVENDKLVIRAYLYFVVREAMSEIRARVHGATMQHITRPEFEAIKIPLPPLEEQREIAWQLERDMDKVERLRAEALRQRKAVEALPSAYLRDAFAGIEAQVWNWERLGDVCTLLPSKSIATEADTEVLAITTACLSEHGFQQSGLKKARMWASDVSECTVIPGEILVARSNTAELVGRATLFSGEVDNVVASDLTIRLWPGPLIFPPFLATYLSFLYQSGYWKERAGGASDSMKKITRSQILRMHIPLPSLDEQNALVQQFEHNMTVVAQLLEAAQRNLASVEALPNVLLREVFGDFTS